MSEYLATLKRSHPRIYIGEDDIARLKELVDKDDTVRRYFDEIRAEADRLLTEPPSPYLVHGGRLLHVSRSAVHQTSVLGLVYLMTGEEKYAEKGAEELLAVSAFPDWNPGHFLDTGEMCHAVGLGYDWLYDFLGPGRRERIRSGLLDLGLKLGKACHKERPGRPGGGRSLGWWVKCHHNWSQVCNGGLTVGALAVADEEPELAEFIVSHAVKTLPTPMAAHAPDGGFPEGPGYWNYATSYTVYMLAALESALGKDFGLSELPGFGETGWFPIHMTGSSGRQFNFADAHGGPASPSDAYFWLGRRFGEPFFVEAQKGLIERAMGKRSTWTAGATPPGEISIDIPKVVMGSRPSPFDLIWYTDPPQGEMPPKCRLFEGVDVVSMRSGWGGEATFVAVKGGDNEANHSHLDLGTFVLDALGERWAMDLGSGYYNLPGYWGWDGSRWEYYRLGSRSHNVIVPAGANQGYAAKGYVTDFDPEGSVRIELSGAYPQQLSSWVRLVRLAGEDVFVRDLVTPKDDMEIAWGMVTGAEVKLRGAVAELTLGGKKLVASILSPEGAAFDVESTRREPPEHSNEGTRKLAIRLEGRRSRRIELEVQFVPQAGS